MEPDIEDYDRIHEGIVKGIEFKGTNLWILMFAIVVASVGLNMNSTAVIIGAMLISPLMGPINGMGYSIATYNFPLLRTSVKNFSFAVISGLLASTAYFALSPISTAHSELLARTSPSIYDVIIALFGGLAGIIAISSKQKGNVIPGVAIATALMPPLCTAGYGLATAQFEFFFGAIYLFTINTVFIAFAALGISQLLGFPIRILLNNGQRKYINRWISFVIVLVLIPSIYFGYNLVQKERFIENAERYIQNISVINNNYLLKNEINADKKLIQLVYGGASLSELDKAQIIDKASDFNLESVTIKFEQGLTLENKLKENTELDALKAELNKMTLSLSQTESKLDSIARSKYLGETLLKEISALYPQIYACSYSQSMIFGDSLNQKGNSDIVILKLSQEREKLYDEDREKLKRFVSQRLKSESLNLYFIEDATQKN